MSNSATVVVHPDDLDVPLPLLGEYRIETSRQVPRRAWVLLSEEQIEQAIEQVLDIGRRAA